MSAAAEPVTLVAPDGTRLAAMRFRPAAAAAGQPGRTPVLMAGALGVPQRYYAPFCSWLAAQGHAVLSFDLRGIGASREPRHARSLRGLRADMLTWARQDFAAALLQAATDAGRPVTVLGHSLGAHHAVMTEPQAQASIATLVSVGAGAGSWRDWAAPSRRPAPWMLNVAGPLLTPLFGYFPGRRLRMVGDLPAGVMRQWSRWCRHPAFAWGAEPALVRPSLDAVRFRITAFAISDDEAMTEACVRTLLAATPHAHTELRRLAPADVGLARLGHLGTFRSENAAVWPVFAAALNR